MTWSGKALIIVIIFLLLEHFTLIKVILILWNDQEKHSLSLWYGNLAYYTMCITAVNPEP